MRPVARVHAAPGASNGSVLRLRSPAGWPSTRGGEAGGHLLRSLAPCRASKPPGEAAEPVAAEPAAVESIAEVAAASAGCEPFTMSMAQPRRLKKKAFTVGGYTPLECVGIASLVAGGLGLIFLAVRKKIMPEVNDLREKLKEPAASNTIMKREIRELKSQRKKAQERVDDLTARLANVEARTEWYSGKLQAVTAAVEAKQATTAETNEEIETTRQELLALQRDAREMRKEKEKAEQRVVDLTERIANAEGRTKWYTDALQSTQAQLEEQMAISRERTQQVVALKNQLTGLYREFREAKTKKEKAEERVVDLKSRMSNSEARTKWYTDTLAANEVKAEELRALGAEAEAQTEASRQELMPLYRKLRETKEQQERADQRVRDLSGRIENAEARAQWYTEELEAAKGKLNEEQEKTTATDDEMAATKQELVELYRQAREAKEVSLEAEKTVEQLEAQIKSNEGRAQWYAREVTSLNEQLEPYRAKQREVDGLKRTLSAAVDRVEGVQDSSHKAVEEVANLRRDIEMVVSAKEAAEAKVAQLSVQIIEAEAKAERFAAEVKGEREQREDAAAAVNKLREVITDATSEAERAGSAAMSAEEELGGERRARMEAEETIQTLRSQIESMQALMRGFREEMGLMKERSEKAFNGVQQKRADISRLNEQIAALEREAGSRPPL